MNVEKHHFCVSLTGSNNRLDYILELISQRTQNVLFTSCPDASQENEDAHTTHQLEIRQAENNEVAEVLPHMGLLLDSDISKKYIELYKRELKVWLANPERKMDFFGQIFLFVSRYEEYTTKVRDQHGRFSAKRSIQYDLDILEVPIVDKLIYHFYLWLQEVFQIEVVFNKPSEPFISTIDVDWPWKYENLLFPFNLKKYKDGVFWKVKQDPYDAYDFITEIHEKVNVEPYMFFLTPGTSRYDYVQRYKEESYQALISKLETSFKIGFHPPYLSYQDKEKLKESKDYLEKITSNQISRCRMHYLRVELPTTYRYLIEMGVEVDFSMGFADAIGFRAGTSRSFYWYDLENEQKTDLLLQPISAMDVTMKNYMTLTRKRAKEKLLNMFENAMSYHGVFHLLWHNSSLDREEWYGWKEVYTEIILHCGEKRKDS